MNLRELKSVLEANLDKQIRFILPDAKEIPQHAHVTEVGHVAKRFIDCGGVTGATETCLLQTWVGNDTEHRLTAERLGKILQLGSRILPHDDLEVEVEYDCCVVGQYPVSRAEITDGHLDLLLENKRTQCLARERRKVGVEPACCDTAACC